MLPWLVIPALAVAAAGVYLARLPKTYVVRRSLSIGADRARVFARIRDFRTWGDWSPWLLHEPHARLTFSPDPDQEGGFYDWDGRHIGAGRIRNQRFDGQSRIDQTLEFRRPFKSRSAVWWELAETGAGTELTWSMQGQMPLPLRPMIPMMREQIGKDFELGLALLRGVLDPEAGGPRIRFAGEVPLEPCSALTIPFAGGIDEMVAAMERGFPRLAGYLAEQGGVPTAPPFSAYHKVDIRKQRFECDIAMPAADRVPAGDFVRKSFAGGRCFKVELTGSYDHLPLAWHAAIGHLRMLKLKIDKSRPMLEVYENDPSAVEDGKALRTALYIPLR